MPVIKRVLVGTIKGMITFRPTLGLFNFLFENMGDKFRSFVIRNVNKQPVNYTWKLTLPNNNHLNLYIDDTFRSWQFAYNYRWYGTPESKVLQIINDYYPVKYHFIDIGANLGLMTLYSVAIKRPGILFEPNKSLNEFTRKQYACNNYTNYVIENYCLSNKIGSATFYISGSSFQSSLNKEFATADAYGGLASTETVELITLDHYINEHPEIIPAIIKIDAEGHDFEVLQGAENILNKTQPSLIIEVCSDERPDIISFMEKLGYKYLGIGEEIKDFLIKPERREQFAKCRDIVFVKDKNLFNKLEAMATGS